MWNDLLTFSFDALGAFLIPLASTHASMHPCISPMRVRTYGTVRACVRVGACVRFQVERHHKTGEKEIDFPDGTRKYILPSGREMSEFPDGVTVVEYPEVTFILLPCVSLSAAAAAVTAWISFVFCDPCDVYNECLCRVFGGDMACLHRSM